MSYLIANLTAKLMPFEVFNEKLCFMIDIE